MGKKRKLPPVKCPDGCKKGECKNKIRKVINDFDTEYCGEHWHVLDFDKVVKEIKITKKKKDRV